jgi:hypothetical protein
MNTVASRFRRILIPCSTDFLAWSGKVFDTAREIVRNPLPSPPKTKRNREKERGDIHDAVAIIGLPRRTVEAMAARSELPGAAKMARRWTFDLRTLRDYVRRQERETWQRSAKPLPGATGGKVFSGVVSRSAAGTSDGAFTRITRPLRGRDGERAKNAR